jgi:hypothetical protein
MHKHKCPVCDVEYNETDDIRSLPHLKRYMALCRAAHFHWPESHPQQFDTWPELRRWLQMKVGHREIGVRIPIVGISKKLALILVEAAIRGSKAGSVPTFHKGEIIIWNARSISYAKLKHYDAVKLFNDVAALIESEIGISADELLRHGEGP